MAVLVLLVSGLIASIQPVGDAGSIQHYFPGEKGAKRLLKPGPDEPKGSIEEVSHVSRNQDGITVTVSRTHTIDWDKIFKRKPLPGSEDIETITRPHVKFLLKNDGLYFVASYERDSETRDFAWKDYSANPSCLLKLPVKQGATWSEENKKLRYRITRTIDRIEKVKVAAGEYEAVVVLVEATQNGNPVPKREYWFVKDVGVVKATLGDEVTLELSSFKQPSNK